MESIGMQVNQRSKGTEKFWSEALLQLQADHLCDAQPRNGKIELASCKLDFKCAAIKQMVPQWFTDGGYSKKKLGFPQ